MVGGVGGKKGKKDFHCGLLNSCLRQPKGHSSEQWG